VLYEDSDVAREQAEQEEPDIGRTPFRRDYGRLLHSPAFRRLQGKTQLFPGHESDFFRNRLTHSLEVAQIAKGIALKLNEEYGYRNTENQIDLDLVEFAGLAHDLGHPPFGHNGEKALDDCMKRYGGFEGNAQTLRILARVEKKIIKEIDGEAGDPCGIRLDGTDRRLGLNLTYRTLASVLKYDNPIPLRRAKGSSLTKGYYNSEAGLVRRIKQSVGKPGQAGVPFKTIECQIMDIADDIAYSIYDLEDAMKGGFTHPLALLTRVGESSILSRVTEKVRREVSSVTLEEVFEAITDLMPSMAGRSDAAPQEAALAGYTESKLYASDGRMRSQYSSEMVGQFIRSVSVDWRHDPNPKFASIVVERKSKIQIESLKHLNYLLTIMSPRLKVVEYRGYEMVRTLFDALSSDDGHLLMPDDVQRMFSRVADTDSKMRIVCDFVAGMTDRYALEFYGRLKETGASIFKPI
jgi:dGTPase